MRELTEEEMEVISLLGTAYNKFGLLYVVHKSDRDEFVAGIHKCQNIILSRPAIDMGEIWENG